jgi:hypothetical protein
MGRARNDSLLGSMNSIELEKRFASGKHPEALLQMINICCIVEAPLPEWVRKGFIKAYLAGESGGIGSWNKVFGPPRTKGQWQRLMRNVRSAHDVWKMVSEAKMRREPIDDKLFGDIGRKLGIGGKTLVSELYGEMCRVLGRPSGAPQNPPK